MALQSNRKIAGPNSITLGTKSQASTGSHSRGSPEPTEVENNLPHQRRGSLAASLRPGGRGAGSGWSPPPYTSATSPGLSPSARKPISPAPLSLRPRLPHPVIPPPGFQGAGSPTPKNRAPAGQAIHLRTKGCLTAGPPARKPGLLSGSDAGPGRGALWGQPWGDGRGSLLAGSVPGARGSLPFGVPGSTAVERPGPGARRSRLLRDASRDVGSNAAHAEDAGA